MSIRLSPRLRALAGFIPAGAVPVDVGTDHAYLPVWLLQEGVCERAYATDLRPGPLARARAGAEEHGVAERLTLFLCDGLALCPPEAVDTVVLAGMGGETILGILDRSPWALDRRLVIQAQTKLPELRAALVERGLAIQDAALADDAGRLYLIWLVGRGPGDPEAAVDAPLLEKRDPLLKPWLAEQIKRASKQLHGLESARAVDGEAVAALRRELTRLRALQREVLQW